MQHSAPFWPIGATGLLVGSLVLGCSHSGVRYSGVVADPSALASDVRVVAELPGGTELGVVAARCEAASGELEDGILYGDLVCSEPLLRAALVDTAAHVGGSHLVDVRCEAEDALQQCQGHVFVQAGRSKLSERPRAFDPFSIEVRLLPAPNATRSRPPGRAAMVPRVPVSDRPIGEVQVDCDGECSAVRLHAALAEGASYAGARHFGYPECRDSDHHRVEHLRGKQSAAVCRSWASAHRVDADTEE